MKEEYVPTKGMKIGIAALIAHFPLMVYAHHITLAAWMVNQQAANAITASVATFVFGFGAVPSEAAPFDLRARRRGLARQPASAPQPYL